MVLGSAGLAVAVAVPVAVAVAVAVAAARRKESTLQVGRSRSAWSMEGSHAPARGQGRSTRREGRRHGGHASSDSSRLQGAQTTHPHGDGLTPLLGDDDAASNSRRETRRRSRATCDPYMILEIPHVEVSEASSAGTSHPAPPRSRLAAALRKIDMAAAALRMTDASTRPSTTVHADDSDMTPPCSDSDVLDMLDGPVAGSLWTEETQTACFADRAQRAATVGLQANPRLTRRRLI